jgi:hypothetical protein
MEFFLLEIIKIWQKSQDFWFADFFLKIFKIHRLVLIFYGYLIVLNLFHQCFVVSYSIINFKFDRRCFIKDYL